jgi:predicted MFS family arabinose efflux permease
MLKPYLVDLGYNVKQIGFMSGIFGTSVAAVSALGAGFLVKWIGRKTSMYLFLLVSLAAAAFFWFISQGTPSVASLYAAVGLLWCGYGLSTVIIYTISMDKVRKGCEGTDFTLQIVVTHLSSLIFAVVSGKLTDKLGYTNLFGIEALLSLFTLIVITYAFRQYKENENI